MMRDYILLLLPLMLLACSGAAPEGDIDAIQGISAECTGALPEPHANNAVALSPDGKALYSFNGLCGGKTWADVSMAAFVCVLKTGACAAMAPPPVDEGRLASTAVTLGGRVYLFGGYTVAEDGAEISTPEVFAFDPVAQIYERRADMPTPVDDAVAFAYADRYIYLVSGWSNDGNVSLVQVYDASEDRWFRASDYPGAPVFGHAGGAAGESFIITDGVAVIGEENGRRQFGAVDEVWRGDIDPGDPAKIAWRRAPAHPSGPLYRMAAGGDEGAARIYFYGGADNPYNYNGVGYDGAAAKPSDALFAYDLARDEWIVLGHSGAPSMVIADWRLQTAPFGFWAA